MVPGFTVEFSVILIVPPLHIEVFARENDGMGTDPFTKNVLVIEDEQPLLEVIVSDTV